MSVNDRAWELWRKIQASSPNAEQGQIVEWIIAALEKERETPRDAEWTLAIGQVFGLDSGLRTPLVPEAFADCLRLFLEHRSKCT